MNEIMKLKMIQSIQDFDLPGYHEIPNVGLFLEQTTKYISSYLEPLEDVNLTGSMISNYVKKKIIKNPIKKQYDRDQIVYLFFIAIAKSVLSLEDIQLLFNLQLETYTVQEAYEYFRKELKDVLFYVFGIKDSLNDYTDRNEEEKTLLRNTVITAAHKVYLDKYFMMLKKENN